eukprot:2805314-Amphidinium_carterae.1
MSEIVASLPVFIHFASFPEECIHVMACFENLIQDMLTTTRRAPLLRFLALPSLEPVTSTSLQETKEWLKPRGDYEEPAADKAAEQEEDEKDEEEDEKDEKGDEEGESDPKALSLAESVRIVPAASPTPNPVLQFRPTKVELSEEKKAPKGIVQRIFFHKNGNSKY